MPGARAPTMPADREAKKHGSFTLSAAPRLMGQGSRGVGTSSSHAGE